MSEPCYRCAVETEGDERRMGTRSDAALHAVLNDLPAAGPSDENVWLCGTCAQMAVAGEMIRRYHAGTLKTDAGRAVVEGLFAAAKVMRERPEVQAVQFLVEDV